MLSRGESVYGTCGSALLSLHFSHCGRILLDGDHVVGDELVFPGYKGQVFLGYVPRHERLKHLPAKFPTCTNSSLHEYIGEVVAGVEAIHLGGLQEAVHQGGCPRTFLASMGDPVLGAEFYNLHKAFGPVVVKVGLGRKERVLDPFPVVQGIGDSALERDAPSVTGKGTVFTPLLQVLQDRQADGVPLLKELILGHPTGPELVPEDPILMIDRPETIQRELDGSLGPCNFTVIDISAAAMCEAGAESRCMQVCRIGRIRIGHAETRIIIEMSERIGSRPSLKVPVPGELIGIEYPYVVLFLGTSLGDRRHLVDVQDLGSPCLLFEKLLHFPDSLINLHVVAVEVLPADVAAVKPECLAVPVEGDMQGIFLIEEISKEKVPDLGLRQETCDGFCRRYAFLAGGLVLERVLHHSCLEADHDIDCLVIFADILTKDPDKHARILKHPDLLFAKCIYLLHDMGAAGKVLLGVLDGLPGFVPCSIGFQQGLVPVPACYLWVLCKEVKVSDRGLLTPHVGCAVQQGNDEAELCLEQALGIDRLICIGDGHPEQRDELFPCGLGQEIVIRYGNGRTGESLVRLAFELRTQCYDDRTVLMAYLNLHKGILS